MKSSRFTGIRRDDRHDAIAQSVTPDRASMHPPPEKSWLRRILDNLNAQEPSIEEGLTSITEASAHGETAYQTFLQSPGASLNRTGAADRSPELRQASHRIASPQSRKAPGRQDWSPPTMIKSGLARDFAYRLYTDGSVEAKLRHGSDGWLRFASIDALRLHLGFSLLQRAGSGAGDC